MISIEEFNSANKSESSNSKWGCSEEDLGEEDFAEDQDEEMEKDINFDSEADVEQMQSKAFYLVVPLSS